VEHPEGVSPVEVPAIEKQPSQPRQRSPLLSQRSERRRLFAETEEERNAVIGEGDQIPLLEPLVVLLFLVKKIAKKPFLAIFEERNGWKAHGKEIEEECE
jgi:hypothetical protein